MQAGLQDAQRVVQRMAECRTVFDLQLVVEETAGALGADYVLMIHHADFTSSPKGLVRLGTFPGIFLRSSRQAGAGLDDPIMDACHRAHEGFFWDEVDRYIRVTDRHRDRMAAVAAMGLADGYVVPIRVAGEPLGSCHFACGPEHRIPRENGAALQLIAMFGFEAARRLVKAEGLVGEHAPVLTGRQRECLILSARGKSDSIIAQLLQLSPRTVNNYVEAAKRRFGVATRAQLIVSALYASEITFSDILPRNPADTAPVAESSASAASAPAGSPPA